MHLSSRATDSSCQIEGTSSGVRQRSNIFFGEYETRIEHEGFMDDLLRKLSQDNGNGMTDPFHIVETKVEKYPIHDVDTHWRMRKPSEYDYDFVGDLFVDIEQLKGCLTYYALERVLIMVLQNCYGKRDDYRDPSRLNPDIKLHEIADLVLKKYKCIVTPNQCRNAKRWALNEGETTIEDHYGYIRSYAKAILESNPGSTVKVGVTVNPDDKTYFDRFYVCFKGLKDGWKLGCRKIIALDGCFLKRPSVGEILTATGRDANNHIFPVAWATGLIEAVKEVMPYAEHPQCARHIYEGFRKVYSGVEFKLLFWHVIPTGGNLFEVRNGSEAFGVDEERRNCSCRLWQLSGNKAFNDTYHQYLTPVGGITFWPDCSDMSRVLPPKPRTMPGRPKKKRIRAAHENKNPNKVSKAGVTMTCTNCHKKGHNKKGCKNPTVVLPPKPPAKKGRPRKTPLVGSSLTDKEIETPDVDEQVGVEEQESQYDVGGSSHFDVGGENKARNNNDVGGSIILMWGRRTSKPI
ncbi:hypothetical protein Tco_0218127 [Tanacetum coccineum]